MICGADAVDVEVDVDAIGHRLLVAVLHHQVLVEEAEGLLGRRGGQADQVGVEVLQHLPPQVVDRAVALVGDDDVEGLDRDRRVVAMGSGVLEQALERSSWSASSVFLGQLASPLSIEYRRWMVVMRHARGRVERVRLQVLDDVQLGELALSSGVTYCSNSFCVCRPRLPRSTRNSTRRAPANLIRR